MRPVLSRILLVCVLFLPLVVILSAPVERAEAQQQGKGLQDAHLQVAFSTHAT